MARIGLDGFGFKFIGIHCLIGYISPQGIDKNTRKWLIIRIIRISVRFICPHSTWEKSIIFSPSTTNNGYTGNEIPAVEGITFIFKYPEF